LEKSSGVRWKDVRFDSSEIRGEQAWYRGSFGTPKTKASKRTIPVPDVLRVPLMRIRGKQRVETEDSLVFQTRNGTPYSDTNLLHKQLNPVVRKLGMPWLSWHTLRRTHATLLQASGASLKDAQAQLGHTKMSTTLEIYTLPIPAQQLETVERLSQLVTNGDESHRFREGLPKPTNITGTTVDSGALPIKPPTLIHQRDLVARPDRTLDPRHKRQPWLHGREPIAS
jgi:hypothetical protein